jgi:alanyl-tRNA synthetase
VNARFKAVVDKQKRDATSSNHTATHLLHQGLRSVMGEHVTQKGSMVRSGYLRFDFSHFSKLTQEELNAVENFVNARIQEQIDAQITPKVPYDQAIEDGAMALFGEKYGDKVRTVRFGESIELCGGTHVSNTAKIWHFTITSESAVASGVRRIEAVTGEEAKKLVYEQAAMMEAVKLQLKNPKDLVQSVQALQEENSKLRKELDKVNTQLVQQMTADLESEIQSHKGISLLCKEVNLNAAGMKDALFQIGKTRKDLVAILGSKKEDKPILSCYVSKELVDQGTYQANTIIKEIGQYIKGGGGGQPFFATAGGKHPAGLSDALQAAKDLL